jgi:hypothetical protein
VLRPVPELLRSVVVFRSLESKISEHVESISNSTRFEELSSSKFAELFHFQLFQQLFHYLHLQRGIIRATLAQVPYLVANDGHKTQKTTEPQPGERWRISDM